MVEHRTPVPPMYRFVANVLRPPLRLLMDYSVRGLENLPESGGFIVTPNHLSYADPFPWAHVLYDRGIAPVYLAKSELFDSAVLGYILRHAGQVPVERETSSAAEVLGRAVQALDRGQCVAIYPEGTLTRDPDLWPMRGKTGAARLALEARCPVIPIAQWGPQEILAPYGRLPRLFPRTTIHVRYGPPVDLSDLYDDGTPSAEACVEATNRIMRGITDELEVLRGERAPAVRFDPRAHGMPLTGDYTRGARPVSRG
ncbi:lysophospholipid acyltransferase family protein [Marihabitans asiaticum]|uniref:1-acyl-sn-glycerol-3-phosphate acyltransferase n=1 Tax=Marihabitans asiaticum TaxID=415218 RepID=A0A560W9H8_9MICO|nr:lysophospholipid acyltransferase family protein [Marihabitans asiaticum]TWD14291.1 1-acyl-sn-glycerol-3-phosphate acyltransferase [Marihabitans asiaticum]